MKEWAKDVQIDHEITLGEEGEIKLYDGSHLDSSFQSTEKYRKTMFMLNKGFNSKFEDGEEHLSAVEAYDKVFLSATLFQQRKKKGTN